MLVKCTTHQHQVLSSMDTLTPIIVATDSVLDYCLTSIATQRLKTHVDILEKVKHRVCNQAVNLRVTVLNEFCGLVYRFVLILECCAGCLPSVIVQTAVSVSV